MKFAEARAQMFRHNFECQIVRDFALHADIRRGKEELTYGWLELQVTSSIAGQQCSSAPGPADAEIELGAEVTRRQIA